MKKVLGSFLLATPFILIYVAVGLKEGWWVASIAFLVISLVVGAVVLGAYLIVN